MSGCEPRASSPPNSAGKKLVPPAVNTPEPEPSELDLDLGGVVIVAGVMLGLADGLGLEGLHEESNMPTRLHGSDGAISAPFVTFSALLSAAAGLLVAMLADMLDVDAVCPPFFDMLVHTLLAVMLSWLALKSSSVLEIPYSLW
mmetsp:Transcript_42871/g.78388  ORF Transcript_42871/g.78388 Transcript_42871/m.78388 type:complete len:144 (-) Transcript_42871:909-1340(-)